MAEQLVNEFTVNRPIEQAWPVICDLESIAPCVRWGSAGLWIAGSLLACAYGCWVLLLDHL